MTNDGTMPSRTFRIFVSSTFEDFKDERNALQHYVFPRLQELCAQHQGRFQAIDLRWGVSEEAGLDQRAVAICLDEIARCQRLTPRPNFIVLLGDRYGWRPLPSQIEKTEFEAILAKVSDAGGSESDRALLLWTGEQPKDHRGWYRLDKNADPAEYVLLPREIEVPEGATADLRTAAQEAEETRWRAIEGRLRAILLAAIDKLGWGEDERAKLKYVASATEQEIVRGALEAERAAEHVFGFFRPIAGLPVVAGAKAFCDLVQTPGGLVVDTDARARLGALKARLRDLLGDHVFSGYEAAWTGSGITTDHLGELPDTLEECLALLDRPDAPHTLCVDVWRSLAGVINTQLDQHGTEETIEREISSHLTFGQARCSDFIGRAAIRKQIARYLAGSEPRPLALIGEGGSGKSALIAKAMEEAGDAHSGTVSVVRFIGATPGSSDGRSLLSSLCRQVAREYGGDESAIPTDYKDLAVEFGKQLEKATAERPLILFLDALDQLGAMDAARGLSWLPSRLPENVRLVVSSLPGDRERTLRAKHPEPRFLTLDKLTRREGKMALRLWLGKARRTLQNHQRSEVLDKFEPEGRPLYLKLAFEEARLWPSYDQTAAERLHVGIPELIEANLFGRLAAPENHGHQLVERTLGYLAASRYGLAEDELVAVVSADDDVMAEFRDRSPRSPKVQQLPVVVWSRLYFDLEPYLAEHAADGGTLLTFYHRVLGEAAARCYLAPEDGPARHSCLADYFKGQADPVGDRTWTGNSVRGLSELPFHLAGANRADELYQTLTDYRFLQHKIAEVGVAEQAGPDGAPVQSYGGVYALQNDFELSLAEIDGGAKRRGPPILTAADLGEGPAVSCPWCRKRSLLKQEWRGEQISCPRCAAPLRVNEFVVGRLT